jgi:Abnormal spindle-like microcephaly-assoc'd, ASPM-SPD-2-Hydin
MHFRVCLEPKWFVNMAGMRSFPGAVVAALLCCMTSVSASGQQIYCHPCNHSFGEVEVGNSSSYSIQLSNTGKRTLRISSKTEQGPAFAFGHFVLPMNVQPGTSVQLPVIFTPIAKGYASGVITLTSNSPNSHLYVHLSGAGLNPGGAQLVVAPSTLNFGNVTVGSSASLQATLTASNSAVTISSDQSTSSEFGILGLTFPVTVSAGQSIPVTIQFTPNASGAATAKAGFISNAKNSPTIEQLTGTGVAQNSHTVDLSWDPGDGNAVGYNVYRSTAQAGPFQEINTALDASTNYIDNSVVAGTTYYYVATEVDAQGQESAYSNVAKAVVPNP